MNENLHDYMRVGIIHFMAYPENMKGDGPALDSIKKIVVDGYFDAIEITWIKDPETRRKVRSLLDSARMTVAYGAQPRLLTTGLNINDTDEDGRKRAVDMLKDGIREAYEMGAVGFAFLSGRYDDRQIKKSFDSLIKSTNEICDFANNIGDMQIIHEIFDHNIDKRSLIGPVSRAVEYAKIVCEDHDNFGLMVDLSHLPLLGESPEEAILPVKDYLKHIHIGNCVVSDPSLPGYGDVHPRFGFPNSENDVHELSAFLRVLLDIGYLNKVDRPIVSFEVKPFGDEDPETVIAGAKRTLDIAWRSI